VHAVALLHVGSIMKAVLFVQLNCSSLLHHVHHSCQWLTAVEILSSEGTAITDGNLNSECG
jgi:hypothetical protein